MDKFRQINAELLVLVLDLGHYSINILQTLHVS